ncbi:NACHT domain-containing protein [Pseudoalteromonas sp. BDTF-M6]|uniref:NACHT domain-containing protein n=1 Tax=Pseudoalteromonas sp. BDTF-M6 TaxID=2796132 RepID=UPI001BB07ECF|nr:NACHT domain-containing protein [Pseudoalteromonas sp. BDTF-M6]MBS3796141.1 NACHT domain-containing protein [Pseudoalteromonas sp. BDTF-M6]
MDSELQKQLNSLKALHEDDFSKLIIKPLFEAMGYQRVDFNGGPFERGKDLIAQIRVPPQTKPTVVYIQSKKIGDIQNTKESAKFTSLTHQLRQCLTGKITTVTGDELKADRVYLACPELASNRFIEEVKEQIFNGDRLPFEFLDGPRIVEFIKDYKPELMKLLQGEANFISEKFQPKLTNQLFYDALNYENKNNHELKDIYCESTITVGNERKFCLLNSAYVVKESKKLVKINEFNEYHLLNEDISVKTGIGLFSKEISTLLLERYNQYHCYIKSEDLLDDEISNKKEFIRNILRNTKFKYPIFGSIEFDLFIGGGFEDLELRTSDKIDFYSEIKNIKEISQLLESLSIKKQELGKNISTVSVPLSIDFNADEIVGVFNKKKSQLLSFGEVTKVNVSGYLKIAKELEEISQVFDYFPEIFEVVRSNESIQRPQINVLDAFQTQNNIILLGDAGSGKTTNLQIFAKLLYERKVQDLIIYATLNEVSRFLPDKNEQVFDNRILDSLLRYLKVEIDPSVNESSLREHLAKSGTILIFDSIDEAIVEFPWIIESLRELTNRFKNIRVITSSRFSVENIAGLGFANISLLPFGEEQKRNFFDKWFLGDSEKVKSIMEHLKNNSALDKIVTNPLSATIMATLQASDVPLPKNETSLYKKRFELLSGVFDRFKGSKRQVCDSSELIECARILAYLMHSANKREWALDTILRKLNDYYDDSSKLEMLVRELQTPSEILLINSNGKLGFGHLRFQEYLASEHIDKQQNHRIDKKLKSSWWHDVLVLYSQHAFQIEWLVNDAASGGYVTKVKTLLREMVANRPQKELQTLTSRIEIALKDESLHG